MFANESSSLSKSDINVLGFFIVIQSLVQQYYYVLSDINMCNKRPFVHKLSLLRELSKGPFQTRIRN